MHGLFQAFDAAPGFPMHPLFPCLFLLAALIWPVAPTMATPAAGSSIETLAAQPPTEPQDEAARIDAAPWQHGPLTLLLAAEVTLDIPHGHAYLAPADAAALFGMAFEPGMPGLIRRGGDELPVSVSWLQTGHYPASSLQIDPEVTLDALRAAKVQNIIPVGMNPEQHRQFFARPSWHVPPAFDPATHTFMWAHSMLQGEGVDARVLRLGRDRVVSFHALTSRANADDTMRALARLAQGVAFVQGHDYPDATAQIPIARATITQWIAGGPTMMQQTLALHEARQVSGGSGRWRGLSLSQAIFVMCLVLTLMIGSYLQKHSTATGRRDRTSSWLQGAPQLVLANGMQLTPPDHATCQLLDDAVPEPEGRAWKCASLQCDGLSYEVYAATPGAFDGTQTRIDPAQTLVLLQRRVDAAAGPRAARSRLAWQHAPAYDAQQQLLGWSYAVNGGVLHVGGALRLGRTALLAVYWTAPAARAGEAYAMARAMAGSTRFAAGQDHADIQPGDRQASGPLQQWVVDGRPD